MRTLLYPTASTNPWISWLVRIIFFQVPSMIYNSQCFEIYEAENCLLTVGGTELLIRLLFPRLLHSRLFSRTSPLLISNETPAATTEPMFILNYTIHWIPVKNYHSKDFSFSLPSSPSFSTSLWHFITCVSPSSPAYNFFHLFSATLRSRLVNCRKHVSVASNLCQTVMNGNESILPSSVPILSDVHSSIKLH